MIRHKTMQGLMSIVLSVIMFMSMMPVSALAETDISPIGESGEIIAIEALGEDISVQSVSFGTAETELKLPGTLTATVRPSVVSGSAIGFVGEEGDRVHPPVTWDSSPIYNSEAVGTYIFSPRLPEEFTLADGVELPIVKVSIAPANDSLLEGTVPIKFINPSGREETVNAKRLTEDTGLWDGWYYVTGYTYLKYRCAVTGDAKIILTDGSYLSAPFGINVWEGDHQIPKRSLTIYGQKEGTGTLYARYYGGAAIGGDESMGAGNITIVGGKVTAYGENGGAGIGGSHGRGATFTMYGGEVYAVGDRYSGSGIGGGAGAPGNTVRIYGGVLNAVGGDRAAGIGGGENGNGGDVYIHGGDITASNGNWGSGAGIGGGENGNGGNVHVYGGTITAKSGLSGAGIGGGQNGHGGNVYINGGTIRAFGGTNGGRNIGGGAGAGTRDGTLKNHLGKSVYLNTLILPDKANRTITAGSTNPDLSYGTQDMQTDENGKVYLYLPQSKGKELVSLTADDVAYYAVYERNGALTQTLYTTPRNWDDVQPFLDLNREGILDISGFVTPDNSEVYTFDVGTNKSFTIKGNGTEIQNIAFSFGRSNTIIIDNLNIRSANYHGRGSIWETEKKCTAPLYFNGSDNTLVVKGTNTITSGQKSLTYGWGSAIGIPFITELTIKAAPGETSAILNAYSNFFGVPVIGDGYRKSGGYAVIEGVTVNRGWDMPGTAPDDNHSDDNDTALETGAQSSSPTDSPQEPNLPIMAVAPVTATAGTNGTAIATIPDITITDAIAKAQADANAEGKTANKISVVLNVTMPQGATSLTTTLTQTALKNLVSAEVTSLKIDGEPVPLVLDLAALEEIQKQSGGTLTISIAPATGLSKEAKALIGNRPVYSITISSIKDGEIINITDLGNGKATLSIPYTPSNKEATGYLFGVYVDANGKPLRIGSSAYDNNANAILIPTGHFSVYGVGYTAPSTKFTDIGTHWSKESIDYVVGRGLLSGTSETTFAPESAMTRGMLVTALGRLAGVDVKAHTTSSFTDVKADSALRPYIEWAFKEGIMLGVDNQQFAPDREITREEIAVIFANYAKATGYKLPVTRDARPYADTSSIESVFKTAIIDMQQAGIMMSSINYHFNPKQSATRAEVSSMLHRYIKLTIDPATAQGWAQNDAGQWFCYRDGKTLTGMQTIDGEKYFFNIDGTLKTGWVKDGDNTWYYSGNKFLTGWQDINNKRYYFYADGTLAKSTKVDGHEVDENGNIKVKSKD